MGLDLSICSLPNLYLLAKDTQHKYNQHAWNQHNSIWSSLTARPPPKNDRGENVGWWKFIHNSKPSINSKLPLSVNNFHTKQQLVITISLKVT